MRAITHEHALRAYAEPPLIYAAAPPRTCRRAFTPRALCYWLGQFFMLGHWLRSRHAWPPRAALIYYRHCLFIVTIPRLNVVVNTPSRHYAVTPTRHHATPARYALLIKIRCRERPRRPRVTTLNGFFDKDDSHYKI